MNQEQEATKYINSIHNSAKRDYANRYYDWAMRGDDAQDCPEPRGISYMAAQAVRQRLSDYFEE